MYKNAIFDIAKFSDFWYKNVSRTQGVCTTSKWTRLGHFLLDIIEKRKPSFHNTHFYKFFCLFEVAM